MSPLTEEASFQLIHAGSGKEIRLAMQRLFLIGKILPVGARLVVQHTFSSEEPKPLEVVYSFPLPRDAALRRFRVTGKGFSVHSQLKPVAEAVKIYEAGIEQGHLSTFVRQYRDGMVNLNLGNLQPKETVTVYLELLSGVELHDRGFRFRFPFTLAPGYHSGAKTVTIEEKSGEIELPEDEFGDLILPQFEKETKKLHQVGFDLSVLLHQPIREIGSPSHAVRFISNGPQQGRVALAQAHDLPNRDLVLDVQTEECLSGVLAGIGRDGKGHFAAIFPSEGFGKLLNAPRRMVFVMDRSGSMQGTPIEQAKKAIEACLGTLSDQDQFGLVTFDNDVDNFTAGLVAGSMNNRESLRRFLQGIDARGGTELAEGFLEAARLLGKDGGDVMLLTDGQVIATESILEKARAAGIRIHTLGIGSASQDRFLSLLSEQTSGVCRFLTPRERVDLAAVDLFASIGRPVATDVRVSVGDLSGAIVKPDPPAMVFSGNPLVVFGECGGTAQGHLRLEWTSDKEKRTLVEPIRFGLNSIGDTLRLIRGAKLITDLESRMPGPEGPHTVRKREEDRIARRLEELSQSYGLASRQMALVAVVERAGDQAGQLPHTHVVPVGMPQDVRFESYFGSAPASNALSFHRRSLGALPQVHFDACYEVSSSAMSNVLSRKASKRVPKSPGRIDIPSQPSEASSTKEDLLLELASKMEPDGGMPGTGDEQRVLATMFTLLFFVREGHTSRSGAFRSHVQRLLAFLRSDRSTLLAPDKKAMVERVCDLVCKDWTISLDWSLFIKQMLAGESVEPGQWGDIEQALAKAERQSEAP